MRTFAPVCFAHSVSGIEIRTLPRAVAPRGAVLVSASDIWIASFCPYRLFSAHDGSLRPFHTSLDVLSLRQLAHRRSSLPGILEDSRARFRESLREEEKSRGDKDASSSRASSGSNHPSVQPPSSSSSHKRPPLKATLSSPAVGRASQPSSSHSPNPPQTPAHTPTPISNEHRKRRISLPDGLEAAVKSSSHALWLPHHAEQHSGDRGSQVNGESHSTHSNGHPSPRPKSSSTSQSHANGHSQHSRPSDYPQTPRRYEAALPHAREQPQLRGSGLPPPPQVSFLSQQPSPPARPLSQMTTSTHRSTRSSPPEKRSSPLPLPAPPAASPAPPAQRPTEPPTPKYVVPSNISRTISDVSIRSTKSNLFSLPAIDDLFSKDETSHSMMSVRRLFGLSTPKHEPRKLEDEERDKEKTHKRRKSKDQNKEQRESAKHLDDSDQRRRAS